MILQRSFLHVPLQLFGGLLEPVKLWIDFSEILLIFPKDFLDFSSYIIEGKGIKNLSG